MNKKTQERFFKKVLKTKNCWIWTAAKNWKGYGQFGIKIGPKKWKIKYAHRLSYILFKGKIPKNLLVLHKCDTPNCINPKHLFLGTDMDNCKDKIKKGRIADTRGEKNGRAILTYKKVSKIRSLYKTNKYTQIELANKFGVKKSIIGRIITNIAWKE